jgi:NAD(P)-dependent dehydrogenase (short-subunit alcohol dehydrogenase family)
VEALKQRYGSRVVPLRLDVTRADQVAGIARQAPDVELLLNNAGVAEATELTSENQEEWQDTHPSIRAIADGAGTYVDLLHEGYQAKSAFYERCVAAWDHYLKSLRAYCETGRGTPWAALQRL